MQLTHEAVLFATRSAQQVVSLPPGSRVISWLPAAHIAERMAHHYIPIVFAGTVTCAPDPRQIVAFLPEVRPNWFFAVPRIWEKLKSGLEAMQAAQPAEQREPAVKALEASLQRVRLQQRGEPVPEELEALVAKADEELFSKLRAMLGLDQVLTVNVGAAPTPPEVLEFFHAIGIEVAELWGMSETCGVGTVNRPGQVKIGTVGPPSPGVEVKLADDGELLCRGPIHDVRLPQPARADGGGAGRRRLAAHRGHRRDRRGRFRHDRRPQEGADHQRGRQEHVAGQHRGRDQDRLSADRHRLLHRRHAAVQHRADRARRRLRARPGRRKTSSATARWSSSPPSPR